MKILAGLHGAMAELLHTVAVVLQQQRPVASVNGRRSCRGLDYVCVGVGLYERHCYGCCGS